MVFLQITVPGNMMQVKRRTENRLRSPIEPAQLSFEQQLFWGCTMSPILLDPLRTIGLQIKQFLAILTADA